MLVKEFTFRKVENSAAFKLKKSPSQTFFNDFLEIVKTLILQHLPWWLTQIRKSFLTSFLQ